jgi:hypothetical protein
LYPPHPSFYTAARSGHHLHLNHLASETVMDPKPESPEPEAQQSTATSSKPPPPAPSPVTKKPVTVAPPHVVGGQLSTLSGIFEGDEGMGLHPPELLAVNGEQLQKVTAQIRVRRREIKMRYRKAYAAPESAGSRRDAKRSCAEIWKCSKVPSKEGECRTTR